MYYYCFPDLKKQNNYFFGKTNTLTGVFVFLIDQRYGGAEASEQMSNLTVLIFM